MSDTSSGWIGVDLDGTLAHYDKWRGITHIGEPVPDMLDRVKNWLSEGKDVRIFTARVCPQPEGRAKTAAYWIRQWCLKHIGQALPITNEKDLAMIELWDDRCVTVQKNTGRILSRSHPC
jgi:hypothetical protein